MRERIGSPASAGLFVGVNEMVYISAGLLTPHAYCPDVGASGLFICEKRKKYLLTRLEIMAYLRGLNKQIWTTPFTTKAKNFGQLKTWANLPQSETPFISTTLWVILWHAFLRATWFRLNSSSTAKAM